MKKNVNKELRKIKDALKVIQDDCNVLFKAINNGEHEGLLEDGFDNVRGNLDELCVALKVYIFLYGVEDLLKNFDTFVILHGFANAVGNK